MAVFPLSLSQPTASSHHAHAKANKGPLYRKVIACLESVSGKYLRNAAGRGRNTRLRHAKETHRDISLFSRIHMYIYRYD